MTGSDASGRLRRGRGVVGVGLALLLASCAPPPPPANSPASSQTATAESSGEAPMSSFTGSSQNTSPLVGVWGNQQTGLLMRLDANGGYQMQGQGVQMLGTWAMGQGGVIAFTANGSTTMYQWSLQNGQLGLQDPQGQVMWFVRAGGNGGGVATAPVESTPAAPFAIPKRYASYNAPVLAYMAETLARQTPENVAQGLASLSATGHQMTGIYTAFAEQLHWFGCQADPGLVLYGTQASGKAAQNCATTEASWQNTYQLSNGSVTPGKCDQCTREQASVIIAYRCTVGLMSKDECSAIMAQMGRQMTADHQTATRIITNMPGGNACMCGDPGCSC